MIAALCTLAALALFVVAVTTLRRGCCVSTAGAVLCLSIGMSSLATSTVAQADDVRFDGLYAAKPPVALAPVAEVDFSGMRCGRAPAAPPAVDQITRITTNLHLTIQEQKETIVALQAELAGMRAQLEAAKQPQDIPAAKPPATVATGMVYRWSDGSWRTAQQPGVSYPTQSGCRLTPQGVRCH